MRTFAPSSSERITVLQNLSLMEEVQRLSLAVQSAERRYTGLPRIAKAFEDEFLHGGWGGRKRFLLRVARGLASRLLRRSILPDIPPLDPTGTEPVPVRFRRLHGDLGAWRAAGIASSQRRALPSPQEESREREARAVWARLGAARPESPYLAALKPHEGKKGPLRVLVFLGGGGIGDALLFSAFLAALHEKLHPCEIVLLFSRSFTPSLYAGNPTVACAVSGTHEELNEAARASRYAGIFDLFVDIFCFLPRYLVCAGSRLDLDRHGRWLSGNQQLGEIIDRFSSNLGVALLDRLFNTHVFDLLACICGLPMDSSSPLVFSPDPAALAAVRALGLPPLYATVRNGSNPGDASAARSLGAERTTKEMPPEKWQEVCAILKGAGLAVVQVGDTADTPCPFADVDLRGRTGFSELCFVMKNAAFHVDTEGGLVHFARAANVPAVVFFGTTSAAFFGYPCNLNIEPDGCKRCWYANATWIARCPRGLAKPECTSSLSTDRLQAHLPSLIEAHTRRRFELVEPAHLPAPAPEETLQDWSLRCARSCAPQGTRIGLLLQQENSRFPGLGCLRDVADGIVLEGAVPGSLYNMPVNSGLYDVLVYVDEQPLPERAAALKDMARLVAHGGLLIVAAQRPSHELRADFVAALRETVPQSPASDAAVGVCYAFRDAGTP